MNTKFDFTRALQAAAHLIKLQPHQQLSYLRLLKLLYIAERELLAEHGTLLTADRPYAMPKGPVLSETLQLITGQIIGKQQQTWRQFIETVGHDVVLKEDPGHGELTRAIRRKLEEVNDRYKELDDWDLVEETHKLPEWQRHFVPGSGSSFPYEWEEVMACQGKEPSAIQAAEKREQTWQGIMATGAK
jgi:uncharacterized phage-associated protein